MVMGIRKSLYKMNKLQCAAVIASLFIITSLLYMFAQPDGTSVHMVWVPLDDRIPFLPAFVLPYVIWYVYVPLPMLYFLFTDRKALLRQTAELFAGVAICIIVFLLYPTGIDFRPAADPKNGFFEFILWLIYKNDKPLNCCPSLHCYEAVIAHLAAFGNSDILRNKAKAAKVGSMFVCILICLSTVFIKQHSIVDSVIGVLLAIGVHFAFGAIFKRSDRKQMAVV